MSRYALDKALWCYARQDAFRRAFDADAKAALGDWELTSAERAALVARDARAIFELGAHPFLLYSFSIAANGGWSFEMMKSYVAALDGLKAGDIET